MASWKHLDCECLGEYKSCINFGSVEILHHYVLVTEALLGSTLCHCPSLSGIKGVALLSGHSEYVRSTFQKVRPHYSIQECFRWFGQVCACIGPLPAPPPIANGSCIPLPRSQPPEVCTLQCRRWHSLTCSDLHVLPCHVAGRNPLPFSRTTEVPWSRACVHPCRFSSDKTRVQPTKGPRGRHTPRRPWQDQRRRPGFIPFSTRDCFPIEREMMSGRSRIGFGIDTKK